MLNVRHVDSQLEVRGALDGDGARMFLAAVASARGDVQVDASGVDRIDGAGLTALAVARLECRAAGRTFAVTCVAPDAVRGLRTRDNVLRLFATPPTPSEPALPSVLDAGTEPVSHPRRGLRFRSRMIHRHDGT
jgi:ABC-type transporter Mla MlaB component